MADFKEVQQKEGETTQDFEKRVADLVGTGYQTVSGFADPEGKESWVQMEKQNKRPSESGTDKRQLITE